MACINCKDKKEKLPEVLRDRYLEKGRSLIVYGTKVEDLTIEDLYVVIGLMEHTHEQYKQDREREAHFLSEISKAKDRMRGQE